MFILIAKLPPQLPSAYTICAAADPVVGISFDPARPATMILWASKFVAAVNINEEVIDISHERS